MLEPEKIFGRLGNKLFQYAYIYSQAREGKIPDIFVQDYRYFDKYREDIKKLYGAGIGFMPFVGIHVRRGDYVNNAFYTDLSETDYYKRAIALFPNKKFLVFSDDPEYCKNMDIFKGSDFQVMERQGELDDFNLLASCEHIICANSSYSWWAAYLCQNWGKQVVIPIDWFQDGVERVISPPEWKQI